MGSTLPRSPIKIQQIQYFLTLYEECSFSRAAEKCGVTQPSLTNAIQMLEAALGGKLFLRKKPIEPTTLARTIHPYCRRIGIEVQKVLRRADTVKGMQPGKQ
jgi:DNA-binding transcriptional LysR family regulator